MLRCSCCYCSLVVVITAMPIPVGNVLESNTVVAAGAIASAAVVAGVLAGNSGCGRSQTAEMLTEECVAAG